MGCWPMADSIAAKVKALLAKATSSEFPAEREAFEAKANQLIFEHQLTQSDLDASDYHQDHRVVSGYGNATEGILGLWSWIAKAYGCFTLLTRLERAVCRVTMIGDADDIAIVAATVDYLAVQLMNDIARDKPRSRKTYSEAWASRAAHRLEDSMTQARIDHQELTGVELVPADTRYDQIAKWATSEFSVRTRGSSTDYSKYGYDLVSGAGAADSADLGQAKVTRATAQLKAAS